MQSKILFELRRKAVHAFALLYIVIYLFFAIRFGQLWGVIALGVVLLAFLVLEFVRLELKIKIPFLHKIWREKEKDRFGGQIYFVLGVLIAFALFDFDIALAAILMTIFGDMAAAIVGVSFGKHKIKSVPDKSWEGVVAQFVVDIIIVVILIDNLFAGIAMALVATYVETKWTAIDDNLSIPVFAGAVGQVLKYVV